MALRLVFNVFLGLAALHVGSGAVTTTEPPKQLPDTSGIDFKLTDKLQVDKFFSLWMVFNNGEVQTSEEPFTIFAPRNNNASHHISNSLLAEPDLVKRLLLDHIVLGLKLNLNLSGDFTITTLGGRTVRVGKVNGSLYANKAKILEPWVEVPNGMLIVVDDYLFPEELIPGNKTTEAQKPPQTAESLVLITAEDDAVPHEAHNTSSASNPFLRSVNQVLSYLRGGFKVFQRFLSNSSVPQHLTEDEEYTVFTPTDPAFHRWHPIDWGFYPFSVPEFTDETILNHFVRGNLRQDTITDGQKATTLGGREVVFKRILSTEIPAGGEGYPVGTFTLTVNGVPVFSGDTPVDHGNVMFIKDVLFVDDKVVQELQAKNRDKETAPLLAFPWVNSQFISHAFIQLQQDSRFTHLARFFSLPDVAPLVTGNDYTFFVPTDDAFAVLGLDTKPDGFLSKSEEQQILLNHIVPSRLYSRDLTDGKELRTLGGKTIHVNHYGENVTVNDANVVQSEVFVYNLGVMYYIDRILFLTKDDLPETTEETSSNTETTTWLTEISEDVEKVPSELTEETGTLPDMLLDDELEATSRTENTNEVVQRIGEDLQDNTTNISDATVLSNEEVTTEFASTEVPLKLNASIVSASTQPPKRK